MCTYIIGIEKRYNFAKKLSDTELLFLKGKQSCSKKITQELAMKLKYLLFSLLLAIPSFIQAADIPMSLAGIRLGEDISTAHHCCKLSTDIPLAEERHLNEIHLQSQFVAGIKTGTVAYANCGQKGRIVRIKLKFDDPSRDFFNDLLRRYEKEFGKPEEWRGDPFQSVISWKWSFRDNTGKRVNLELTHSKDEDYKMGNFVKLSLRSLWEEEAACLKRSQENSSTGDSSPTPRDKLDYRQLIPR